jgi:hypothetical protein
VKLSDVNKVDPKNTSLDDYKTALDFLKIPDMDIFFDDETNKQRYICAYDMYLFLKGSLVPLALSIIACLLVFSAATRYPDYFPDNSLLSYMWPWNRSMSERLSSVGRGEEANIVSSITGIISTIWLSWTTVRLATEIKVQGQFYIPKMVFACAIISTLMWWGSSVDFIGAPSFGPTIEDPYTILSIKKGVFISLSYWTSGYFITLSAPYFRFLIKTTFSKFKRNTP